MKHNYAISGLTCSGCESKVRSLLKQNPLITDVSFNEDRNIAEIQMTKHVPVSEMIAALAPYPKYNISEIHDTPQILKTETKSFEKT